MASLKIYVCAHTDFDCPVKAKEYKVMDARSLKMELPCPSRFYSEFATFKKIAGYKSLPKYVGFCQYRRYFDFMNDVPDVEKLFEECDVVAARPMRFNVNTYQQYARSHNAEDLDIVRDIVKEKYPEYYEGLEAMLKGNRLYANDMFIMRREDFKRLVEYVFDVIGEYLERIGTTDIEGWVKENREKYVKAKGLGASEAYQTRIGGYLMERLTSAFIMQLGRVKEFPIRVIGERR